MGSWEQAGESGNGEWENKNGNFLEVATSNLEGY